MHFTAQKVHLPLLLKPCFEILEPLSLVLGPDTCVNSRGKKRLCGDLIITNYINISHESKLRGVPIWLAMLLIG